MIITLNFSQFIDNWPESRKDQFSYEALKALFDYLEESNGEKVEFDPIALCCEYSEYKSAWKAMEEYQSEDMPVIDLEEHDGIDLIELGELQEKEALKWLQDRTQVIELESGGVVIQKF